MHFTGKLCHYNHKEPGDKKPTFIYYPLEIHLPLHHNDIPVCLSAMTFIVIAHRYKAESGKTF